MNTYQWIALAIILISMIFGQLFTSMLGAFILWFKTKSTMKIELESFQKEVHVSLTGQGSRIGSLESELKSSISIDRCTQCQLERERLGKLLIDENRKEHTNLMNLVDNNSKTQEKLLTAVTTLTSNVEHVTVGVEKLFELWDGHVLKEKK